MTKYFVSLCTTGECAASEIYDFVGRWHASDSNSSLAAYLGMTDDEYGLWVERSDALELILLARRKTTSVGLAVYLDSPIAESARIAASGFQESLLNWLKSTGRAT